ncbi:MAG: hypothetical protein P8Z78_14920 [Gammaproteobacteria bacterium]|jgi:hypothetical protein
MKKPKMNDQQLIRSLIHLWYSEKAWAEELLRRVFGLTEAREILCKKFRGDHSIPGTNWRYRTHGVGVDIYQTSDVGGIDFDFDKPDPDAWRIQLFLMKQYNAGNLSFDSYRNFIEDEEHFKTLLKQDLPLLIDSSQ